MPNERLTYLLVQASRKQATAEEYDELLGLIQGDSTGDVLQELDELHAPAAVTPFTEHERDAMFEAVLSADRPTKVVRPFFRRWMAAAAVIALIAGTYFFVARNNTQAPPVAQKPANLPPGHQGAILTLSNHQQIVLDSAANGSLANEGGTTVQKTNGQITYIAGNTNTVLYNTMTTPRGRQFQLVLPDGSRVWLNASSSITYPTAFTGNERKVTVTGEAYFEVQHDASKPFSVVTAKETVTVLGTHFNVMAYDDEPAIHTTLLEGSVKVSAGGQNNIIRPGEEAVLANNSLQVKKTDTTNAVAWVRGQMALENATIETVMRQVSRWYNVDVKLEGDMPPTKFFGMIDRNVYLPDLLSVLEAKGFQTRMEGNTLIVSAK